MTSKILILFLIIIILVMAFWFIGRPLLQKNSSNEIASSPEPTQTITPTITIAPTATSIPTTEPQSPIVPAGWQTYKNTQYNFTVSYPSGYKALTDKENLYGWPNAVVLFYGGGQSYDVPVEVWDKEADYKEKYPNTEVIVYKKDGKFITLVDQNNSTENKKIIDTFQFTD